VKALWTSDEALQWHFTFSYADPNCKYIFIGLRKILESQKFILGSGVIYCVVLFKSRKGKLKILVYSESLKEGN
jgi:hypothetical protein